MKEDEFGLAEEHTSANEYSHGPKSDTGILQWVPAAGDSGKRVTVYCDSLLNVWDTFSLGDGVVLKPKVYKGFKFVRPWFDPWYEIPERP